MNAYYFLGLDDVILATDEARDVAVMTGMGDAPFNSGSVAQWDCVTRRIPGWVGKTLRDLGTFGGRSVENVGVEVRRRAPHMDWPTDEALFRDRVPAAAARQLGTVLAHAVECEMATLAGLRLRKSTSATDLRRHEEIVSTLVQQCRELNVPPRGLRGSPCPRLAAQIAPSTENA